MSRRPSHWPTKFSVNAAAFGSFSIRSTCARSVSGWLQLALLGEGEQLLVGHRAPQEVRQPAGQGEVVEFAGLLAEEQEVRRHQHGLEADAHRLLERVLRVQLGLHAGEKRLDVLVGHRPPKGAAHEVAEDALGIGQGVLRDDLHAIAVVGGGCLLQVAEEPAMARRRPGVVQRPFDLHPLGGCPSGGGGSMKSWSPQERLFVSMRISTEPDLPVIRNSDRMREQVNIFPSKPG